MVLAWIELADQGFHEVEVGEMGGGCAAAMDGPLKKW